MPFKSTNGLPPPPIMLDFMLGHPIDTAETIDKTINFAVSNPFDDVVVTTTTPILGTELHAIANKYGAFLYR